MAEREESTPRRWLQRAAIATAGLAIAGAALWWALPRRSAAPPAATTTVSPHRRAPRPRPRPRTLALPRSLPQKSVELPILMYHRIDALRPSLPSITERLTVTPAAFAAEMQWLRRDGFHPISDSQAFAALERGAPLPRRPIMITFDDGYRDVLRNAAPLLARLHFPATEYVITSRISGPDPSFLSWPELAQLERDGVAIGSHTVTHTELTTESASQARWELDASRAALQRHLGHPVQWFSYPAGAEDGRVAALVRQAGYVLAVTTHPGTRQRADDPLELRRLEVLDTTGVGGLAQLLG